MLQGIVKFFNQEKGFGFIKYEGDKEIFVHITAVEGQQPLAEGENVSFEIGEGRKGPMAINVQKDAASANEGTFDEPADETDEDME